MGDEITFSVWSQKLFVSINFISLECLFII